MKSTDAIGIFDSGIGGLTVAKEIARILPQENIYYLGDTKRVPYGNREKDTIISFAKQLMAFLLSKQVKCLVIACNTISSLGLEELRAMSPVPIIDVISPSIPEIINTTTIKRIGIIGTNATISSNAYQHAIKKIDPTIDVIAKACPLFVPMIEEGLTTGDITEHVVAYYISSFKNIVDTLHLACTHYPLIQNEIQKVVGEYITLIDCAHPTSRAVKKTLEQHSLLNTSATKPIHTFYVTEKTQRLYTTTQEFFGENISSQIEKITLG